MSFILSTRTETERLILQLETKMNSSLTKFFKMVVDLQEERYGCPLHELYLTKRQIGGDLVSGVGVFVWHQISSFFGLFRVLNSLTSPSLLNLLCTFRSQIEHRHHPGLVIARDQL